MCPMSGEQQRLYEAVAAGRIREELESMGWTADGTADPSVAALEKASHLSHKITQVCARTRSCMRPLAWPREPPLTVFGVWVYVCDGPSSRGMTGAKGLLPPVPIWRTPTGVG